MMVIFEKNNFLIKDGKGNYVLSHESNALKQEVHPLSFDHEAYSRQAHLPQVKKIINNGYNMYRHVKRIAVNNANRLSVNQLELRIQNNNIVWDTWTTSNNIAPMENTEECLIPGTQIKMTRFDLGYNAEAWMDSRGILHLRCNKAGIQEISIAMIHNKPTACWAADGTCCGSGYFTGDNRKVLPVAKFYEMYIQPVIDFLK